MVQTNDLLAVFIAFILTLLLSYIILSYSYFIFFVFPLVFLLCFYPINLWKKKFLVVGVILGYIASFSFI